MGVRTHACMHMVYACMHTCMAYNLLTRRAGTCETAIQGPSHPSRLRPAKVRARVRVRAIIAPLSSQAAKVGVRVRLGLGQG